MHFLNKEISCNAMFYMKYSSYPTSQVSKSFKKNHIWTQVSGTNVTLSVSNEQSASFTAPNAASTLEFSLIMSDEFGAQIVIILLLLSLPHPQLLCQDQNQETVFICC
jgi:hypothetical protein